MNENLITRIELSISLIEGITFIQKNKNLEIKQSCIQLIDNIESGIDSIKPIAQLLKNSIENDLDDTIVNLKKMISMLSNIFAKIIEQEIEKHGEISFNLKGKCFEFMLSTHNFTIFSHNFLYFLSNGDTYPEQTFVIGINIFENTQNIFENGYIYAPDDENQKQILCCPTCSEKKFTPYKTEFRYLSDEFKNHQLPIVLLVKCAFCDKIYPKHQIK